MSTAARVPTGLLSPTSAPGAGVVFVVFAPFGHDRVLSRWPGDAAGRVSPIERQPLVKHLKQVAAEGVHVCAMVDLFEQETWLVDIPAGAPASLRSTNLWKQDLTQAQALEALLVHAHTQYPGAQPVLSLEGHGMGYLPEVRSAAVARMPPAGAPNTPIVSPMLPAVSPMLPAVSPMLPIVSPMLPAVSPMLPAGHRPLSNWALGEALRLARKRGVPKLPVVHLASCFNASYELLHTLAPHAQQATAYANYNFFTAGAAYPAVFKRLRRQGAASAAELGRWFAEENQRHLEKMDGHPTLGASFDLARLRRDTAPALDALATVLTTALEQGGDGAVRRIRQAAQHALHFDSDGNQALAAPDQLTDLGGFAEHLVARFAKATDQEHGPAVRDAAQALLDTLRGTWIYGDTGRPWADERQIWDFNDPQLGLNIFFPDPSRKGLWDWRSPFYFTGQVTEDGMQPHIIDALADRDGAPPPWVRFLLAYHRGQKNVRLAKPGAPRVLASNPGFHSTARELPARFRR